MADNIDFSTMTIDDIDEYRKSQRAIREEAALKEKEAAEAVIYIPDEEIGSVPIDEYKMIPAAVRKHIEHIALFAAIITAFTVAVFILITFNFFLLLVMIGIDMFCIAAAYQAYACGMSNEVTTFDGMVYSCVEHGLKGLNKHFTITIYNEEADKFLSFNYHKKVNIGSPIILYLDKKAKISMGENGPEIDSFITVKFSQKLEDGTNDSLEKGEETIEDYLSS